ncbi:CocE/NonD family hydrolase [Novosphingobium umbonatum]|uniref:CocE/NonD family hydrolase n=1 Tax=Novosphingobium umbonatum TaxID=1908524 RepID=A0A437N8T7_9SPHN|nr:CocE/NonD family hydrolase [Novosphingobium umbonatum]RVU06339.1 CocE/NonD family hydrolase [Novosphingobium umbonatum]
MPRFPLLAATALTAALLAQPLCAQTAPVTPMTPDVVDKYDEVRPEADFIRREIMVPMRDGTKLYTAIVMKKGTKNAPILLSRTPYNAHGDVTRTKSQRLREIVPAMDVEFVEDGYIRVYQDIRGLHRSEGQLVMNRPIVGPLNNTGIDESTDAYDTIDWLVKNLPESNGKVGIIGSSYLGFTSLAAIINPHPALKAAVPQSPMVDGWMGDDWFHYGAFRQNSFDYALGQSTGKADAGADIPRGAGDDYTAYLEAGSAGDFARKWGVDQVPFVRKLMENPAYTDFWSGQAVDKWLAERPLTVPTMLVVGQWDQEDSYGAPAAYRALEPKDKDNTMVSLVIGPWRHSGVNHYGYDLGPLTFAGDTAREFRVKWLKPFFDHHLKGAADPHTPPVLTYDTGAQRWDVSPKWPMGKLTPLYLGENFTASFSAPKQAGHDDYVSDPAHPVPYAPRPTNMGNRAQWTTWLVTDQRFAEGRPDVLTYQTAPLDKPVHIMGAPSVDLFAATSGTDSDWVVKLIDVAPNDTPENGSQGSKPANPGFQLPLGIEIFRGRYVHSFAKPEALKPGKVEEFRFDLPNIDHVVLPGHRIMVQVQSSLFPLYDRNPQSFVPNIFNAKPADYKVATQSIQRGGGKPSAVLIPIVE